MIRILPDTPTETGATCADPTTPTACGRDDDHDERWQAGVCAYIAEGSDDGRTCAAAPEPAGRTPEDAEAAEARWRLRGGRLLPVATDVPEDEDPPAPEPDLRTAGGVAHFVRQVAREAVAHEATHARRERRAGRPTEPGQVLAPLAEALQDIGETTTSSMTSEALVKAAVRAIRDGHAGTYNWRETVERVAGLLGCHPAALDTVAPALKAEVASLREVRAERDRLREQVERLEAEVAALKATPEPPQGGRPAPGHTVRQDLEEPVGLYVAVLDPQGRTVARYRPTADWPVDIGAGPTCTVRVSGGCPDKVHARIEALGAGFVLQQVSGAVRCSVNGDYVERRLLLPTDTVRVGDVALVVRDDGPLRAAVARCERQADDDDDDQPHGDEVTMDLPAACAGEEIAARDVRPGSVVWHPPICGSRPGVVVRLTDGKGIECPAQDRPWPWGHFAASRVRELATALTREECEEVAALDTEGAVAWCERRARRHLSPAKRQRLEAAGWRVGDAAEFLQTDLPRVVEWPELQPGDLALDVGADPEAHCPLVLVRASGRYQWRRRDGIAPGGSLSLQGLRRAADSADTPLPPRAVLVAREVKANAAAVRRAWEAVADRARALADEARRAAPEVLPRVVKWADLRPGDLALDSGATIRIWRQDGIRSGSWRRDDGTRASGTREGVGTSPECTMSRRAVLLARGVPKRASAIRAAWEAVKGEAAVLADEARRPAEATPEGLPRVVKWADLRPGDLALRRADDAVIPLVRVGSDGFVSVRRADGRAEDDCRRVAYERDYGTRPGDRLVLVARGVPKRASAIRAAWEAVREQAERLAEQVRRDA